MGLEVGGAERALARLVTANHSAGHDHLIVSLTGLGVMGAELKSQGLNVASLEIAGVGSLLGAWLRLRRLISDFAPDIVQTWMYHADLVGGTAAYSLGLRDIVWSIRNTKVPMDTPRQHLVSRICAWLSYRVPRAIVCAAETARTAYTSAGYNPTIMSVIPNGFEFLTFDKVLAASQSAQRTGDLVVGCVGRWHVDKGVDLLVSAFHQLVNSGSPARLLLVGRGLDWDNAELATKIDALGLREHVELMGERRDVPQQLARMDIFCMPSRTEGFPNGLAEAMAMCRTCVATPVGDTGLLLGDTGLLATAPNAEAIAATLRQAMALPQEERLAMGQAAGDRVRALFGIDAMQARYQGLYEQLLQE